MFVGAWGSDPEGVVGTVGEVGRWLVRDGEEMIVCQSGGVDLDSDSVII